MDWIYESPDKGKTITKRILGHHEAQLAGKQLMIAQDSWWSMDSLKELAQSLHDQQCLRHEYPALQQLWDEYHAMLKLVQK